MVASSRVINAAEPRRGGFEIISPNPTMKSFTRAFLKGHSTSIAYKDGTIARVSSQPKVQYSSSAQGPLDGVKILDLTRVLAVCHHPSGLLLHIP